ncbi:MAG: metal ABC transporter substrate-binding protein [Acidimicrobiia bacterium]|nr:metal ABC transporter substrate-binding protein [Acidimicrobiia bacterium]
MRTTLILRMTGAVLALALASSACASDASDGSSFTVVVTTSILGDIVTNATELGANVEVIMPVGADPHEFEPSARQVASIRSADLVIANGLGLEEGLEDVLASAAEDGGLVLEVGPAINPLTLGSSGDLDPHVWLDPTRMAAAVDVVVGALRGLDPSVDWAQIAAPYRQELLDLDVWIDARLAAIPQEDRVLVTGHQAFGYFADRYDFEIIATILPGATTMVEPSAAGFADIVTILEASDTPAVFTDLGENQALADQLSVQVDRPVLVVPLYTGALGEQGSGAGTYLEMMRWDVEAIARAFE